MDAAHPTKWLHGTPAHSLCSIRPPQPTLCCPVPAPIGGHPLPCPAAAAPCHREPHCRHNTVTPAVSPPHPWLHCTPAHSLHSDRLPQPTLCCPTPVLPPAHPSQPCFSASRPPLHVLRHCTPFSGPFRACILGCTFEASSQSIHEVWGHVRYGQSTQERAPRRWVHEVHKMPGARLPPIFLVPGAHGHTQRS